MIWEDLRKSMREANALGARFKIAGDTIEIAGELPDELRRAPSPDLLRDYLGAESADNEALDFLDTLRVESDTSSGSVHGLSVSKTAAGDLLVSPGTDFHGSLGLPTS